jgi:hypothetical protein
MKAWFSLLLVGALACGKPLCQVEVSEPGRRVWFGQDVWPGVAGTEALSGKIFILPVDLELLQSPACLDCNAKLESWFSSAFEQAVAEGLKGTKSFQVVKRREDADHLVLIKVSKVASYSKLASALSVLPLENYFGYWLKVVEVRTNKAVFAFQDQAVYFSERDLQGSARRLCRAIEKHKVIKGTTGPIG